MRTLADEILDALPRLIIAHPMGARVGAVAQAVACSEADARAAIKRLRDGGRALLIRYDGSKARYLAPLDMRFPGHDRACAFCGLVFTPPYKSRRRCCGRSCGIRWSWTKPGVAESRRASIKAAKATPEAAASAVEANRRRWSREGERERLSAQNRQHWADPVGRATRSAAIQAVHGSEEARKAHSERRIAMWQDPEYRARTIAAMRGAKKNKRAKAVPA